LLAALVFGRRVHRLHPPRLGLLVAAMVLVSVAWHVWLGQRLAEDGPGSPMSWLPAYLTWFAIGMTLAFAHVRLQEGLEGRLVRTFTLLGSLPGACWVAVGGLMLAAATPIAGPTQLFVASPAESLAKHLIYALIGGLIVVTGVFAVPRSPYAVVMGHPVLRHLGHISYSTFCLHLPVLYFVFKWGGFDLFRGRSFEIWVITVVVSLVISELAYRLVERPAQRLRGVALRRPVKGSQPSASAQADTTRS
jgi:peptidoglycan/LPS O-acetylase OafA/YrhL